MRVLVFDLDGSVVRQPALAKLLDAGEATLVRAQDLAHKLRIVANKAAWSALGARLDEVDINKNDEPCLIFYGSGDFHHLCSLFLSRLNDPVTVVHFDNHPDWTNFPATDNCGGWVSRALALRQVARIVTIGPSSTDFVHPQLKFANLRAIREGRLEVHPWNAAPSILWGNPISSPGCRSEDGKLIWHNLAIESWPHFIGDLDARLPDTPLWISLDKDVLSPEEATTNWDQGFVKLDEILEAIAILARRREIRGIDVCGDYSQPQFRGLFRFVLSLFDRPRQALPSNEAIEINALSNRRIIDGVRKILA
jgi:hypothetical protein